MLCIIFTLFSFKIYLKNIYKSKVLQQPKDNYDYILVLGARIDEDGPSPFLKERLDKAFEFYKKKKKH